MRRLSGLVVGLAIAGPMFSGVSWAQSRDFAIVNDTPQTIVEMWLSVHGDNTWHPTKGFKYLPPGDSVDVSFDYDGPCEVQLRVKLYDGSTAEWRDGFNLCEVSSIKIWYDANASIYQAVYQ